MIGPRRGLSDAGTISRKGPRSQGSEGATGYGAGVVRVTPEGWSARTEEGRLAEAVAEGDGREGGVELDVAGLLIAEQLEFGRPGF